MKAILRTLLDWLRRAFAALLAKLKALLQSELRRILAVLVLWGIVALLVAVILIWVLGKIFGTWLGPVGILALLVGFAATRLRHLRARG